MNLEQYNRRMLIKRTSLTGEVPTIPSSGSGAIDVNDHTAGGWRPTDLYVGEMYVNTADDRAWIRFADQIVELDVITGYPSFTDLVDTPASYSGEASKLLAVNSAETGLEFIDNTTVTSITDLSDTPATITDDKVLVGDSGSYVEQDYITTFDGLEDTEVFSGNALSIYRVNAAETSLEAVAGSSVFVDLTSLQTAAGIKTFSDEIILNDTLTINSNIDLNGNIFDTLITDTALVGALNTNIASTLAVKTYIDNQVITATGGLYVDLSTNQTVEGVKTFSDNSIFSSDLTVEGDMYTESIIQDLTGYHYTGNESTNGSYRTYITLSGALTTELRTAGVWNEYSVLPSVFSEITDGHLDYEGNTIAYLSDISASNLSSVLSEGNTTGGNDIIQTIGDYFRDSTSNSFVELTPNYVSLWSGDAGIDLLDGSDIDFYVGDIGMNISISDGVWFTTNDTNKLTVQTDASGGNYNNILDFDGMSSTRTWTYPDSSGTIALTSDIPGSYWEIVIGTLSTVDYRGVTIGTRTGTVGAYTLSVGLNNEISGDASVCIGSSSTVSGDYSLSIGYNSKYGGNIVSGAASVCIGSSSTVSGDYSLVSGFDNTCTKDECFIVGGGNNITYNNSYIIGSSNSITTNGGSCSIIGSHHSTITNAGSTASNCTIIGGNNNDISPVSTSVTESVIIGGNNITATESNRTYTGRLELDTQDEEALVMKDTVTGTRYKLYIASGVLTVARV